MIRRGKYAELGNFGILKKSFLLLKKLKNTKSVQLWKYGAGLLGTGEQTCSIR